MKSWKTTALGIVTIALGVLGAFKAYLTGGSIDGTLLTTVAASVVSGFGLIAARDNNKSSEDVGAK